MAAQRRIRGACALKLGARVLREGISGADVEGLQRALSHLGFYRDSPDSIFGLLTKEAVREFQREALLTCDGVAGPQVFRALASFPLQRITCVVQHGDTLSSLAVRHGITPGLLARRNRIAPGTPLRVGQALVVPCRSLVVSCYPAVTSTPGIAQHTVRPEAVASLATAVVTRGLQVAPDGSASLLPADPAAERMRRLCVLFRKRQLVAVSAAGSGPDELEGFFLAGKAQDTLARAVSQECAHPEVGGIVLAISPHGGHPGLAAGWRRTVLRLARETSERRVRMRVILPYATLAGNRALQEAVRALDAAVFRFVTDLPLPLSLSPSPSPSLSPPLPPPPSLDPSPASGPGLPVSPWRFEIAAGGGGVRDGTGSDPLAYVGMAVSRSAAGVFLWPPMWQENDSFWKGVGDCMAVRDEE